MSKDGTEVNEDSLSVVTAGMSIYVQNDNLQKLHISST